MSQFDINETKTRLQSRGIRPSIQRLKIMEHLYEHVKDHPTAEAIYTALSPEIPTLSRATVYNTLHSFHRAGLINCLNLDGLESHYDVLLELHGHFRCHECGGIFDFPVSIDNLHAEGLEQFQIDHRNIIFTGLCPVCLNKSKKGE
jgi:Fe2+ or Zn2+ uptake regulation protein